MDVEEDEGYKMELQHVLSSKTRLSDMKAEDKEKSDNRKAASKSTSLGEKKCRRAVYSTSSMRVAVEMVNHHGYTIRRAASVCGVPFSTLNHRMRRSTGDQVDVRNGRRPMLSRDHEEMLVRYLEELAEFGYTHSISHLAQLGSNMAEFYKLKTHNQAGSLGRKWVRCLHQRAPKLQEIRNMKLPHVTPQLPVDWTRVKESRSAVEIIVPHLVKKHQNSSDGTGTSGLKQHDDN